MWCIRTLYTRKYIYHPYLEILLTRFSVRYLVTTDDLWPPYKNNMILLPDKMHLNAKYGNIHASYLDVYCPQCFQSLTSGDIRPYTPSKNNRTLLLNIMQKIFMPSLLNIHVSYLEIYCAHKVLEFDLQWPQMTFHMEQQATTFSYQYGITTYYAWELSEFLFMRYSVIKVFRVWPLLTSDNPWPLTITIGFFLPI